MHRPLILLLAALPLLPLACTSEDNPSFNDAYIPPDPTEPDAQNTTDTRTAADTPDTHGTSQPTEPDTYDWNNDPSCHWDCFGGVPTCIGNEVIAYRNNPIPCSVGISKCDYNAHTCEQGCRVGITYPDDYINDFVNNIPLDILCVENTPTIGSYCSEYFECLLVENREAFPPVIDYLKCDAPSRRCVSTLPSPPPDYLQPCGLPETQTTESFVEAPACEGGVCIVHYDDDASLSACERSLQGCTQFCVSDIQCPLGSLCVAAGQFGGVFRFACKPSSPNRWSDLGLSNTCE